NACWSGLSLHIGHHNSQFKHHLKKSDVRVTCQGHQAVSFCWMHSVIPTPQQVTYSSERYVTPRLPGVRVYGGAVVVGEWLVGQLGERFGEGGELVKGVQIAMRIGGEAPLGMTAEELAVFGEPNGAEQGYVLRIEQGG